MNTKIMSGKGWEIFYEFLHLTFYNYCWIEMMVYYAIDIGVLKEIVLFNV